MFAREYDEKCARHLWENMLEVDTANTITAISVAYALTHSVAHSQHHCSQFLPSDIHLDMKTVRLNCCSCCCSAQFNFVNELFLIQTKLDFNTTLLYETSLTFCYFCYKIK